MATEAVGNKKPMPAHYYGDIVRRIFLFAGATMVITLPFFYELINLPIYIPLLAIVVLVLLAGLQDPWHRSITIVNQVSSIIGCVVFEYVSVKLFLETGSLSFPFFWVNQGLAALFFIATYYSSKTVRGVLFGNDSKK